MSDTPATQSAPPARKIVVLDGFTANPGDLDWAALRALGPCEIHDRTAPAEVAKRAAGADVVLTNKAPLDAAAFAELPELRYVGVLATGYNVVDLGAARARGVTVTNVPAYSTPSVAQATFALILELANRTGHHARAVREGRWSSAPDFCFWEGALVELSGLTMGLIGFGQIGRAVARIAQAFGMRVLTVRRRASDAEPGVEFCELEEVFRRADVLSLHCPLTEETRGVVNAARLAQMKPTAFLINTSRGPLVDEAALAHALEAGTIAGAGLDVLAVEPPPAGNPLLQVRHCVITPHIAWATRASRARLIEIAAGNLRAFLAGAPRNVVS
jgi:glycerate dehydrogenase